jgi:CheY-like chemotaxis protein
LSYETLEHLCFCITRPIEHLSWASWALAQGKWHEDLQVDEALLQAETNALDAILLDVLMPGMDGFQCYATLKAKPVTCTIPAILLTAKVLPDDRACFVRMEIAGVITKPFDPTLLCDQVAELLGWQV